MSYSWRVVSDILWRSLTLHVAPFKSLNIIGTELDRSATYDFLLCSIVTMDLPCTIFETKAIIQNSPTLNTRTAEDSLGFFKGDWAQNGEWCLYQMVKNICPYISWFRPITGIGYGTDGQTYKQTDLHYCVLHGFACWRAIRTNLKLWHQWTASDTEYTAAYVHGVNHHTSHDPKSAKDGAGENSN